MSDARLAALLLGLALLARTVSFLTCGIFGTDGGQMLFMADLISEGRWAEACGFTYHPGYPAAVAFAKPLFGGTERAGTWVSALLGASAVVPLFLAGKEALGRLPAMLGGLAYAFHPHLVDLQSDVMTEGAFICCATWAAWFTLKGLRAPGWTWSVASGLAASSAYLVRPEGLAVAALALAWPLAGLWRFRDRIPARLGGLALTLAAAGLLAFPFLSWVRSVKGQWSVSAKQSVARGLEADTRVGATTEQAGERYAKLGLAAIKVSGALLPFLAAGLWGLRGRLGWDGLVWLSFPAAHLAGLFYAFRTHPFVSYRYLLPPLAMGLLVAGLGLAMGLAALERRGRVRAGWVLALLVVLVPSVRALKPERNDLAALREAAAWIRSRGASMDDVMYSTLDQLGYLSGCRVTWMPDRLEDARAAFGDGRIRWLAYTGEDLGRKPPYLGELSRDALLEPPREFGGSGGDRRIYVHRVSGSGPRPGLPEKR